MQYKKQFLFEQVTEGILQVNAAMENRPHVIDGKTVDPKRAVPRDQSQRNEANVSSKRLYISGVREGHTEEMFTDYFSNYGNVIKVDFSPKLLSNPEFENVEEREICEINLTRNLFVNFFLQPYSNFSSLLTNFHFFPAFLIKFFIFFRPFNSFA